MGYVRSRPRDKDSSVHGLSRRYREYSQGSKGMRDKKAANKGHDY